MASVRRDRRSFARIQLELSTSLYLFEAEVQHSGSILDLSLGGCFFPIDTDPPIGEPCHIKLTLGEGLKTETINLSGVIARTDERGVGIQFIATSDAETRRLSKILGY